MANNRKPSLHKQNSNKGSLYRKGNSSSLHRNNKRNNRRNNRRSNRGNAGNGIDYQALFLTILSAIVAILLSLLSIIAQGLSVIFREMKKNPKMARNVLGLLILILGILFVTSALNSNDNGNQEITAPSVLIGNNSIGTVYKEGPYGNADSDVTIAYILGVHPREKGAHQLMEQAIKEKAGGLNYSYYLYKINVSGDSTGFESSRMNGQKLAQEYAVPDMINNNFTLAVDVHYSNGHWGVSRFMFTPRENNTLSNQIAHGICDKFEWMTYYVPPDPSSPAYVTEPLNEGNVSAVIYEAYTEDANNVTLEHDKEIIEFIDNWNFANDSNEKPFIFF